MKYLLLVALLCSGCAICFNPAHKNLTTPVPPPVTTSGVKTKIDETKDELVKAGQASQGINKSANKAQNLTERVDKILEELDKQQQKP